MIALKSVILAVTLIILLDRQALGVPTSILDQRQTGKYNLDVSLDNLVILVAFPSKPENASSEALDFFDVGSLGLLGRKNIQAAVENEEEPSGNDDEYSGLRILEIFKKGTKSQQAPAEQEDEADEKEEEEKEKTTSVEKPLERNVSSSSGIAEKTGRSMKKDQGQFSVHKINDKNEKLPKPAGNNVNDKLLVEPSKLKPDKNQAATHKIQDKILLNQGNIDVEKSINKKDKASAVSKLGWKRIEVLENEDAKDYKLIGDGIENCGPGRVRTSSGICVVDGSFPE